MEAASLRVYRWVMENIWEIWVRFWIPVIRKSSTNQFEGSILLAGIAIVVAAFLIWRSDRKQAAVGRRFVNFLITLSLFVSAFC